MNRLLAGSLGFLNALLAIAFIILSLVAGPSVGQMLGIGELHGLGLGLLAGSLLAVIVCGSLAILLNIRDSLASIAKSLSQQNE